MNRYAQSAHKIIGEMNARSVARNEKMKKRNETLGTCRECRFNLEEYGRNLKGERFLCKCAHADRWGSHLGHFINKICDNGKFERKQS